MREICQDGDCVGFYVKKHLSLFHDVTNVKPTDNPDFSRGRYTGVTPRPAVRKSSVLYG